jgi:ubiquitin C-terminal hydrolase
MHYIGFNNIGNTCYLNAGLQMIINNKDLCQIIIKNEKISPEMEMISNFIRLYNDDNTKSLTPDKIKMLVAKENNEFIGYKQNDSFEFIIYFLDIIFSKIKTNIYEIESKINIKCKLKSCLNISSTFEKNNFLLLNINDNTKDLDDCYRIYKDRDKLMDDNAYYCEKCKCKRMASKRLEIIKWPKHLIIVLKRFNHYGRCSKIDKSIDVPINWRHNYKLQGIVCHSGTAYGGHYIYIGNHNDNWIIFNDDYTKIIGENELNNYKNSGYIYYFKQS